MFTVELCSMCPSGGNQVDGLPPAPVASFDQSRTHTQADVYNATVTLKVDKSFFVNFLKFPTHFQMVPAVNRQPGFRRKDS